MSKYSRQRKTTTECCIEKGLRNSFQDFEGYFFPEFLQFPQQFFLRFVEEFLLWFLQNFLLRSHQEFQPGGPSGILTRNFNQGSLQKFLPEFLHKLLTRFLQNSFKTFFWDSCINSFRNFSRNSTSSLRKSSRMFLWNFSGVLQECYSSISIFRKSYRASLMNSSQTNHEGTQFRGIRRKKTPGGILEGTPGGITKETPGQISEIFPGEILEGAHGEHLDGFPEGILGIILE